MALILQVLPFQHLYQLLNEGAVEAVIAFQEVGQKKEPGIYKEFLRIPAAAVLPVDHPLAQRTTLSAGDLREEKLILTEPHRCPAGLNQIQQELSAEKVVSDLLFCDSAEVSTTLVKAGFGIAALPDLPVLKDPALAYVPLEGVEPLSYGVYYKSLSAKPMLKCFLQLCRETFSLPEGK